MYNDKMFRDCKPENILLDSKGHVRISDLGLAIEYHLQLVKLIFWFWSKIQHHIMIYEYMYDISHLDLDIFQVLQSRSLRARQWGAEWARWGTFVFVFCHICICIVWHLYLYSMTFSFIFLFCDICIFILWHLYFYFLHLYYICNCILWHLYLYYIL